MRGTKGPRIRFPPGTFVRMADDLMEYEVVQPYRLQAAPSNWCYRLRRLRERGSPTVRFEQQKSEHHIWWEPQRFIPESSFQYQYHRTVMNESMLRLAEFLVDDVMEM